MKTILSALYTMLLGAITLYLSNLVVKWLIPMGWLGLILAILLISFISAKTGPLQLLLLSPYKKILGQRTALTISALMCVILFILISIYLFWTYGGQEGHWIIGCLSGVVVAYDLLVASAVGLFSVRDMKG